MALECRLSMERCTHGLLEREGVLAVLDDALAAARAGSGRLVTVWGDPGIGKSEILGAARERAARAGMLVLGACGIELERDFAFGAALRLVEPALEGLGEETRRAVFAGQAAPAAALFDGFVPATVANGTDHGYLLVHGLRRLVVHLARLSRPGDGDGSALVVLDDAHWADESSLRLLVHLSAGIEALPVTVVVAARRHEPDAPTELLEGLAGRDGARSVRLAPLSERAASLMVRSVFAEAAPAFCRACYRVSGGNPFYLGELLAAARADGMPASAESAPQVEGLAPESVVRSVVLRMAKLPHNAATLASAVAVLGDGASLRHAGALAGLDEEAAEVAADTLAAAGILHPEEPLAFVHPLIGAAIHADLPSLACSRLHRRSAELLDAEGAPAETVAAHLLISRPSGDRRAVTILAAAAARAADRGEHQASRRFIERALAEPPAPEDRADLAVELALAEAATGSPHALPRLRDTLALVGDCRQRARLLGALARLEFARSKFAAAAEAVDAALAGLDAADPLARSMLATRMVIGGGAPRAGEKVTSPLADLLRSGEPPEDPGLLALLAAATAWRGGPAREVGELAQKALEGLGADDGFYGVLAGGAVMALIFVDELEVAAVAIDRALRHARDTGSLIALATASHWRAELLYRQGALADAIVESHQTLKVCSAGWDMCSPWVVSLLVHAHIDRGQNGVAAEILRTSTSSDDGSAEHLLTLGARGRLALAEGDPETALCHLKAVGHLTDGPGTPPTVLAWRTWAALAALQLGDRDGALDLGYAQLEQARAIGSPGTLGAALRVAGLATGGKKGVDLVTESVAVLESSPSALERARSLVDLGTLLRRSGRSVAARDPLRAGLDLAETLGAIPLACRARRELSAAGGRRRKPQAVTGPAALTPSERLVVKLAAQGFTTPQIARSLYLSAKTVDWHLGHAYRKLNVSSRRQLSTALDEAQPG